MVEKKISRFSNEELQLIKNTFCEKDELLYIIRKVIWQIDLDKEEQKLLKTVMTPDIAKLLRKIFLPELEGGQPLHQEVDLWLTLKLEDKTPEDAQPHIEARQMLIDYLDQQLGELSGEDRDRGIILGNLIIDKNYVYLTARNLVISHTEQQLTQIKLLAGTKDETPEETLERLKKDSNK